MEEYQGCIGRVRMGVNKQINYKKPCTIKIWYWNYRSKENNYQSDNKQIHFEILQNNERITLLTWYIPDFLNGIELVNQFMVNKYRVLKMLPKINYSSNFESDKLSSDLVEIIMGENDVREF